jgi:hypothetical protein
MENVEGKTSPPRPPNWLSNTKYRPPGYFSGAITFSLRLLDGRRLTVALLLSYIHLLKTNNKYQEHHHHKPSTVNRPPSMKQILSILLILLFAAPAFAQKNASKPEDAEKAIKKTINNFFEGMEKGDTVLLKGACMPDMVLQTFMADKEGNMQVYTQDFSEFVMMVGNPGQDQYDERIKFEAIHAEQSLASVWTPYSFYINGKRSHCGTNSFQLVKTKQGWKIQYIIDTRRKQGCK